MVVSAIPVGHATIGSGSAPIDQLSPAGAHYACYPEAEYFNEAFGYRDYLQAVAAVRLRGRGHPLALHVHIPSAATAAGPGTRACPTRKRGKAAIYLSYLKREIAMQGQLFAGMNRLDRLYLSGVTAAELSDAQVGELMNELRSWFAFAPDRSGDYVLEVDPRKVAPQRLPAMRALGFNRISLDLRTADPEPRPSLTMPCGGLLAMVHAARGADFRRVRVDLGYGLPGQTVFGLAQALAALIDAAPDLVALTHCVPAPRAKAQRGAPALPDSVARHDMLALCVKRLTAAGYVHIGLDEFALPADELAMAQRHGSLQRSVRGYSTHADSERVACGLGAISAVGTTYGQNARTLDAYYDAIDSNELPVARGATLTMDDVLRRSIIHMLMCNFELSIAAIEQAYPITFASYFASELKQLDVFARAGWLSLDPEWLSLNPQRRQLVRQVCTVFDRYRKGAPAAARTCAPGA